jgi:hypothetical protein
MKKLIKWKTKALVYGITLLFVSAIMFTGCKKDNNPASLTNKQQGKVYTIKEGMVTFKTITGYRNFLDNMTEADRTGFINDVNSNTGFKPLSKSAKLAARASTNRLVLTGVDTLDDDIEDILESDFLTRLINADGLVQIGDYMFNIDVVNQKCYAMHTYWLGTDSSRIIYNYLYNGDARNQYIFEFSTEQDVLEELEALGFPRYKNDIRQTPNGLFCREAGKRAQKDDGTEYFQKPNNFYRVKCKANYQKAGVYFALYGKIRQQYNDCLYTSRTATDFLCHWNTGLWRSNYASYQWRFKPRCWSERVQGYVTTVTYSNNIRKIWAWESSRSLAKFDFQIQWKVDGILREGQYFTTRIYQVKDGY